MFSYLKVFFIPVWNSVNYKTSVLGLSDDKWLKRLDIFVGGFIHRLQNVRGAKKRNLFCQWKVFCSLNKKFIILLTRFRWRVTMSHRNLHWFIMPHRSHIYLIRICIIMIVLLLCWKQLKVIFFKYILNLISYNLKSSDFRDFKRYQLHNEQFSVMARNPTYRAILVLFKENSNIMPKKL